MKAQRRHALAQAIQLSAAARLPGRRRGAGRRPARAHHARHRHRSPARASSGRDRRPGAGADAHARGHRAHRPDLGRRHRAAADRPRARRSTPSSIPRQLRLPARRRRRRRGLGHRSTCATSVPSACWCWSTACAGSTSPRPRACGAATDLNTIPLAIVERIEVLEDGASAIYGSDAIAGVVNIITRRKFDGASASRALRRVRATATARPPSGDLALGRQQRALQPGSSAPATPSRTASARRDRDQRRVPGAGHRHRLRQSASPQRPLRLHAIRTAATASDLR